jgi:hypothetical protein
MTLRDLAQGDRRFEAETYLSGGYGLRLAIERQQGWRRLGELAATWQPLRLKGIQVGPDDGTPFLAATQVFDIRPVPRKWLALTRTERAASRFVTPGQILVTCSGAVGRATLAHAPHEGVLISHDLLRVDACKPAQRGWLYAYLRAPQTRAMMSGAQYGHIIKHLETTHLDTLPVPDIDEATAQDFGQRVTCLLELRNKSYMQTLEAERLFELAVGPLDSMEDEAGFVGKAGQWFHGRRRLEANYHAPRVGAILQRIRQIGLTDAVGEVSKRVWWMNRFKRVLGDGGIPFLSANELFSINPTVLKRILVDPAQPQDDFKVQAGWIVMARSGQVYGLNGSAMLTTEEHERQFLSDDLIRIIPDRNKIRAGFLLTALTHPTLGRPLVTRAAYGTSIPHLDPFDISAVPVVRFDATVENAIADCAESSAAARAEADALERELSEDAGRLIDGFIASGSLVGMASLHPRVIRRSGPLAR